MQHGSSSVPGEGEALACHHASIHLSCRTNHEGVRDAPNRNCLRHKLGHMDGPGCAAAKSLLAPARRVLSQGACDEVKHLDRGVYGWYQVSFGCADLVERVSASKPVCWHERPAVCSVGLLR